MYNFIQKITNDDRNKKQKNKIQVTKKIGCKAEMIVKRIAKYIEYKFDKTPSKGTFDEVSKEIKYSFPDVDFKEFFIVFVLDIHDVHQVEGIVRY